MSLANRTIDRTIQVSDFQTVLLVANLEDSLLDQCGLPARSQESKANFGLSNVQIIQSENRKSIFNQEDSLVASVICQKLSAFFVV